MEADYNFPKMMKRKEIDDVNDDFSDFSLSSPARKIRRLVNIPPCLLASFSFFNVRFYFLVRSK